MSAIQKLLTDHIDIWIAAETEKKSGRGRSSSNAGSVYGVKKLRELILELAVRGKLVAQDARDLPASELVKRIKIEKAELLAKGSIKKSKPLPAIDKEENPTVLPDGWEWVRLGEITSIRGGSTPSMNKSEYWNGDIPWISPKDMHGGMIVDSELKITAAAMTETNLELVPTGSILIVGRSGILKRKLPAQITAVPCAVNQDIKAVTPIRPLSGRYLQLIFFGNERNILVRDVKQGTTVQSLVYESLFSRPFGLPPEAEQYRIVAKVDELMALCDQLEARHSNAADAHEQLVSHLLRTITQSQSAAHFNANWQRIAAHFDTLFTSEASIDALKQTLLQLAVMGKLVAQDVNDEPASALLKRFQVEKGKLIAEGTIKKGQPLVAITAEEKKFGIPQGWEWTRLKDVVYVLGDGLHGTPKYSPNEKCYFINGNNLQNGIIEIKSETKTISEKEMDKHKKNLNYRTILVSINGTIGNVAFYNNEKIALGKSACYFNLANQISKDYLRLLIESPYFASYAARSVSGTTIMNLSLAAMNNFPLPIAPFPEQLRIVAKVSEFMAMCDRLSSRIVNAKQQRKKLADVLVEHAVIG